MSNGELHVYDFAHDNSRSLGRHDSLQAAALSPDGRTFVTAGADRELHFWDVGTGNMHGVWTAGPAPVTSLEFLPDGTGLIAGTRKNKAVIWSLADQTILGELAQFPAGVDRVRVSPDGKLAACLSGKELSVWDLPNRARLGLLENHADQINDIVFSPNGEMLAAATGTHRPVASGAVLIWDIAARKLLHQFHGHKAAVNAARFAPDGKSIASCSTDGSLRLWKLDRH